MAVSYKVKTILHLKYYKIYNILTIERNNMFVQIDTKQDNALMAWGPYPFTGCTHECEDIDYDDYCNNPNKYIYNKETMSISINPDYQNILLQEEKNKKLEENDQKRDERLASGVEYKDIMWDCDTDQKANLLGVAQFMNEGDSIRWYGMDNESAVLTKADMMELGALIVSLTNAVWTQNANIKYQIEQAQNIAEVQKIYVDYNNLPSVLGILTGDENNG